MLPLRSYIKATKHRAYSIWEEGRGVSGVIEGEGEVVTIDWQ